MAREIRTRWQFEPSDFKCVGPSMTKQADANETDINVIVGRYMKTGDAGILNVRSGRFGDVTDAQEYQGCMETIRQAQAMFAELPAELRDAFGNDPQELLAAVHDPARSGELRALGLEVVTESSSPDTAPATPVAPAVPGATA